MLVRKISKEIEEHLKSGSDKIMLLEGARQIGKSYIIREVGSRLFKNFVEINFVRDSEKEQYFQNVRTTEEFYLSLSMFAGNKLGKFEDTLIFLDEIQHYPQYLTMLKFLREEHRFRYIASGSLLGITLRQTTSIPVGSIIRKEMYQLDFEEFLMANGWGDDALNHLRNCYDAKQSLSPEHHERLMTEFKRYLIVGGLPDAVNEYLASKNVMKVREVQKAVSEMYSEDASKYEDSSSRKLLVRRIYKLIPSQMENKKKRIVAKDIRGKEGDRFDKYREEFEYLISSGIALNVNAISNPAYPLAESVQKSLLKLYLNDVGILTSALYGVNLTPVLNDVRSVNLGAVYESVVAQELKAHGHKLFYYDNRNRGEVDYLVDDHSTTSVLPIEVKSGRDFAKHSALDGFMSNPDYNISSAIVFSNEREVQTKDRILYMPIYFVMFVGDDKRKDESEYVF